MAKMAIKIGERSRNLPPASVLVGGKGRETEEGEKSVREGRRERAGMKNEEGRRREEKKKGLLGF